MTEADPAPPALLTVGHGTAGQEALAATLTGAGVEVLVDVRRFPASRAHPHVGREALQHWLPERGVCYRWDPRLGGRRRLPRGSASPDTWWTVEAFRAYAAHTRTPEFVAALDELVDQARRHRVAVMCSESLWWRCHRRLIADVVVLTRKLPVLHVVSRGVPTPHRAAAGARVRSDGLLVWDGQTPVR